MHFLYPAFLFALGALAIPVLVHLFNFRRYKKIYFSNVQFLKEVNEQQASRRNLKERLILAARLLVVLFLILAFAKPYVPGKQAAVAGKQQAVSIFIDNSYSMQTLNREGSLLDDAKRRAKEVASAYSINDRFQLLTQDFEGKYQRLLNRDEFNDAVDAVKISPQSRTLTQIIDRQQSLLNDQAGALKSAYLISDFQKAIGGSMGTIKADSGIKVNLIQIPANSLANVAVDSVWLLSAVHPPQEAEKLVVRLHNYADERADKVPLKLLVNGVQKAIGSFTLKPREVQNDTLSFSGLQAGWQRGEIQLQDNPVTFDNQFHFTFNVRKEMPVLLIDGAIPNKYAEAVFKADLFFKLVSVADGNVNYAGLGNYPLVVLSDVKDISAGLGQQLKAYVQKGGSLAFFPSADGDLQSYRAMLQPMGVAYPEQIVNDSTRVSAINLSSAIFKDIFESIPQNPDLPVVKRYFRLSNSGSGSENIMELPGHQPFWVKYNSGKGKVYVSSVPLDESYSTLPRHALFVPILFKIALLSGHDLPLFYTLGRDEMIETIPIQTTEKQLLKLVQGNREIIPDMRRQEGSTLLYVSDQLSNTGIYELKKQDSIAGVLAFNDSRRESELSYLNKDELKQMMPKAGEVITAGKASVANAVTDTTFGIQLWKLCIILALISLAAEILLIKFYKVGKQPFTTPG